MRTKVFNDLLTWIEENLSAQMKVDDIAKKSGYSRRYIYQLFVDKLGITPIEYLRGRRLCQATNWLKLTKVSGRQIAKKLGYSCYQAFSRDFRQYFKVTPKEFRKNNQLTQVALANILGVTKKTIEKWEQGVNNINGSSAVLLKLLNDNPSLLSQLYSVKVAEGKQEVEQYETIDSRVVTVSEKSRKPVPISLMPVAAML